MYCHPQCPPSLSRPPCSHVLRGECSAGCCCFRSSSRTAHVQCDCLALSALRPVLHGLRFGGAHLLKAHLREGTGETAVAVAKTPFFYLFPPSLTPVLQTSLGLRCGKIWGMASSWKTRVRQSIALPADLRKVHSLSCGGTREGRRRRETIGPPSGSAFESLFWSSSDAVAELQPSHGRFTVDVRAGSTVCF